MTDPTKTKRGTGRTTRMMQEAYRLAKEGKAVYVIARQCKELQDKADLECPGGAIKCEPYLPPGFDWKFMRPLGAHTNCVWLVDHHMVESDYEFRAMYEAMTRFDICEPTNYARAHSGYQGEDIRRWWNFMDQLMGMDDESQD